MADSINNFTLEKSTDQVSWSFIDSNINGAALSYNDTTGGSVYYRLTGYTTNGVVIPYNIVSSLAGVWTNFRLDTGSFALVKNSGAFPGDEGRANMALAVVGKNIYFYGGRRENSTAKSNIWTASVDSPHTIKDSGVHLPDALFNQTLLIISGTMYMFGGQASSNAFTNSIYVASTSNPLVWTNAGSSSSLPNNIAGHAMYVVDGKIYTLGGSNSNGLINNIYTASVSNPLLWGMGRTGSLAATQLSVVQVDNSLIAYGGATNSNPSPYIFTASKSTPLTWATASTTNMPGGAANLGLAIGNRHYQFGGISGSVTGSLWYFESSAPYTPVSTGVNTTPGLNGLTLGRNTLCYSSSNGQAYVITYGGANSGGDAVGEVIFSASVITSLSGSPDANYGDMQPWRTLTSFFS